MLYFDYIGVYYWAVESIVFKFIEVVSYCVYSSAACFGSQSCVSEIQLSWSHRVHFHYCIQLSQGLTVSGFEFRCVTVKIQALNHYAMLALDYKKVSSGYWYKRFFKCTKKGKFWEIGYKLNMNVLEDWVSFWNYCLKWMFIF